MHKICFCTKQYLNKIVKIGKYFYLVKPKTTVGIMNRFGLRSKIVTKYIVLYSNFFKNKGRFKKIISSEEYIKNKEKFHPVRLKGDWKYYECELIKIKRKERKNFKDCFIRKSILCKK